MEKLDFTKEYLFESSIAKLIPMQEEHYPLLLPYSLNEPTLWQYSLTPADGEENLRNYMNMALQKREKQDSYPFIVWDKRSSSVAGSTRFYDYQKVHNTVQLGYTWYGKDFQGTGLNKHCKYLMLEAAFELFGLVRVEFRADATNARSIAAMKSLGCTVEGILRNNCASVTGRRDSIILSILKEEWEGGIKENLKARLV